MFDKPTRSYFFRSLVAAHKGDLSWREARLMFKGATVAAIDYATRRRPRLGVA